MVIDCLSVILSSFDYLFVFAGKSFSFVYFLLFHVFFHFSFPDIPYFSCSLSSFFNLHQVSAQPPILKGTLLMEELGEAEADLSITSFLLSSQIIG